MKEIKRIEWIWKKITDKKNPIHIRIPLDAPILIKGNYLIKIYRLESEET